MSEEAESVIRIRHDWDELVVTDGRAWAYLHPNGFGEVPKLCLWHGSLGDPIAVSHLLALPNAKDWVKVEVLARCGWFEVFFRGVPVLKFVTAIGWLPGNKPTTDLYIACDCDIRYWHRDETADCDLCMQSNSERERSFRDVSLLGLIQSAVHVNVHVNTMNGGEE